MNKSTVVRKLWNKCYSTSPEWFKSLVSLQCLTCVAGASLNAQCHQLTLNFTEYLRAGIYKLSFTKMTIFLSFSTSIHSFSNPFELKNDTPMLMSNICSKWNILKTLNYILLLIKSNQQFETFTRLDTLFFKSLSLLQHWPNSNWWSPNKFFDAVCKPKHSSTRQTVFRM